MTGDLRPSGATSTATSTSTTGRDAYTRLIADLDASGARWAASYVALADARKAEELAGSVTGTVLPFSYDERLELIADPALQDCGTAGLRRAVLQRRAARPLDRAGQRGHLHLARPRIARIVAT